MTKTRDCCEEGTEWRYDSDDHSSLTTLLVDAIAEFEGIDPMDPDFSLYESVDTDVLEELFASATGTTLRTEFRAVGVLVCVCKTADDDTVVRVSSPDEQ